MGGSRVLGRGEPQNTDGIVHVVRPSTGLRRVDAMPSASRGGGGGVEGGCPPSSMEKEDVRRNLMTLGSQIY